MAAKVPPAALVQRFRPQLVALGSWWREASRGRKLTLTSWWRSKAHNESVGGQPTSQHLVGTAIDVVGIPLADAQRIAARLGLTAIASNRGAVHVQALPSGTVARLLRSDPGLIG